MKVDPRGEAARSLRNSIAMRVLPMVMITASLAIPVPAFALRPFTVTDASIVERGVLELGIGPLEYIRIGRRNFLIVPSLVVTFGFAPRWEVSIHGRDFVELDAPSGEATVQVVDAGVTFKTLIRSGSLQESSGPSLGIEFGLLLPTVSTLPRVGAAASFVASHRWEAATIHANGALTYSRLGNLGLFSGIALEGPSRWTVRPVAELFLDYETAIGATRSALVGAIWQARELLSFDLAGRAALAADVPVYEVRAGLTWDIRLVKRR